MNYLKIKAIVFILTVVIAPFCTALGQGRTVQITLDIDNKEILLCNNFDVYFHIGDINLQADINNSSFIVPESILVNDQVNFTFVYANYKLRFLDVPMSKSSLSYKWSLSVDNKPFNKEKYWTIKKWRNVCLVYQLTNDNGSEITISKEKRFF